jgi:hypothetical protein
VYVSWHARAGKTSLLCALAGKASYGRVTGKVYINGCLDRLDRYKKVCVQLLVKGSPERGLQLEKSLMPGYW